MKNNPFVTKAFTTIWSKFFNASKQGLNFKFIKNVAFVKSKWFPLYYNVGKNITNGMSYVLDLEEKDFKGNTFLLHDVPSYFNLEAPEFSDLKCFKVKQYKGFLAKLDAFESYDAFAKNQFKSNTRYKFRRNQERLETCFNISYSIYNDSIEKDRYITIMKGFKALLTKRFNELQKGNDILETWDYYYALIFKMLQEKRALLITICNNDKPIGVSLSFLSDTTMFYAITSFDTDYYRFNLGHTTIIKLFNWCFENGYTIYDFSKGEYEYKNRWTNMEYVYENHILYDSKSLVASAVAKFVKSKYELKQYLRDKNVNEKYVKIKFLLKGKKAKTVVRRAYSIEKLKEIKVLDTMVLIDLQHEKYSFLKPIVFDELYKNPEDISVLNIYAIKNLDKDGYCVVGEKNKYKITFS
ncbi:GNAT family N-acetyltransferase [Lacinutrix sp. C3R15]|uniref:GNAT family N-acetyltransferase n=1 Tax=Flavobacteriaceae TaxID=49546 RepID=UPI001C0A5038|nr:MULTISPECIES: GNAT family N-acetyltransferase [Flavobacteriaceae]MBU2938631.1 GNAT family N-acetyltransferase [Lacinutrix sp. C3R15]MDO6621945.1 GNAT family N-acetyltransferase [Oceanihabitans sp. 1_MG-2023]